MSQDVNTVFIKDAPSRQHIVDIFDGEWSSAMPEGSGLVSTPGHAGLFEDPRIDWAQQVLGGFEGKRVLELGPLEAAHTYMLHKAGAQEIVSIESNARAFLKCLCVKELFDLDRVKFHLGDFVQFLEQTEEHYDVIVASGVLYHMVDPVRLLELMAAHSDQVMIWTHYYDQEILSANPALAPKFVGSEDRTHGDHAYRGTWYEYQRALDWKGFSGGTSDGSVWLELESLRGAISHFGLTNQVEAFHDLDHVNGPSIAICATRD